MTTTTERAARKSPGETLAGEAIVPVKLVLAAAKTRVSLPAAVLRDLFEVLRIRANPLRSDLTVKSG